jgi:methylated-DNA-[protein]-cysteine S-methyltransferase
MKAVFKIETSPILELSKKQLNEYFTGSRRTFDIPLHPIGTDFQKKVWRALLNVPYGETRSYKEIAISMGNPNGTRAVAGAIGANGISIFIPITKAQFIVHRCQDDFSTRRTVILDTYLLHYIRYD